MDFNSSGAMTTRTSKNQIFPNLEGNIIVVIGGGHFGSKAATFTKKKRARTIIIDKNPQCEAMFVADIIDKHFEAENFQNIKEGEVVLVVNEGIRFLIDIFSFVIPDWVVPAIPIHMAGLLVKKWLERKNRIVKNWNEKFSQVLKGLPRNIVVTADETSAVIVTSYMAKNKICVTNCPAPPDTCLSTGRLKPAPMYKMLEFAVWNIPQFSKIFISRQLGVEVGAVSGQELFDVITGIENLSLPSSLAIGTACRCHGVLNLFKISKS